MSSRRTFLQHSLILGASGILTGSLTGCAASYGRPSPETMPYSQKPSPTTPTRQVASRRKEGPPPDLFDAAILDIDFWIKPRTLSVYRPATGERASELYWKEGQIQEAAYNRLCHLLRDVNGKASMPMDPRLLEVLWGTQAFVSRFGNSSPIEILSGYRTQASNRRLQEKGIPAARKSLHIEGKAADIRIRGLDPGVLGNLVKSFRQGGVGFYYRPSTAGGWIHVDTGLQRTWKG
jgi:uncharacterized protein YcbK (DUF882 family)